MLFLSATSNALSTNEPNYVLIGGLITVLIALSKVIGIFAEWIKNKYSDEKTSVVKLDEETLKIFKNIKDDVETNNEKLEEHLVEENMTLETIRNIATCLKEVSHSQEKLMEKFEKDIEKLNDKIEKDIDKLNGKIDRINIVGVR